MRRMLVVAAFVIVAVGVAIANLPVADDTTVYASGLVAMPEGCSTIDVLADGAGFITWRKDGSAVRRVELREGAVRSFLFLPNEYDSLYVGLDTATEVVITWIP